MRVSSIMCVSCLFCSVPVCSWSWGHVRTSSLIPSPPRVDCHADVSCCPVSIRVPGGKPVVRNHDLLKISKTGDLGGALLELEMDATAAERRRAAVHGALKGVATVVGGSTGGASPLSSSAGTSATAELQAFFASKRRPSKVDFTPTAALRAMARQQEAEERERRAREAAGGGSDGDDDDDATAPRGRSVYDAIEPAAPARKQMFVSVNEKGELVASPERQDSDAVRAALVSAAVVSDSSSLSAKLQRRAVTLRQLSAAQRHVSRQPDKVTVKLTTDLANHLFKGQFV